MDIKTFLPLRGYEDCKYFIVKCRVGPSTSHGASCSVNRVIGVFSGNPVVFDHSETQRILGMIDVSGGELLAMLMWSHE